MTNLEFNLTVICLMILTFLVIVFYYKNKKYIHFLEQDRNCHIDIADRQEETIEVLKNTISELEETIDSLQLRITSLTNMNKMLGSAPPSFVEDDSIVVESFKQRAARHKVVFTAKQKQRIREAYLQNLSNRKYTLVKLVEMLNKEFGLDKPYNYYRNIWKENQ